MNGVCGVSSVFSPARYLVTKDPNYLWTALWLSLVRCMFDLFDGKIAWWRKACSMFGSQELDSLADLVRMFPPDVILRSLILFLRLADGYGSCVSNSYGIYTHHKIRARRVVNTTPFQCDPTALSIIQLPWVNPTSASPITRYAGCWTTLYGTGVTSWRLCGGVVAHWLRTSRLTLTWLAHDSSLARERKKKDGGDARAGGFYS